MKAYVFAIAVLSTLAGCQTLRHVENPLSNAYSGFDDDRDGVISQQEAQQLPSLAQNFRRVDTNSSGGIDEKEYSAANMHLADLSFDDVDVNEDGVVSEREAAAMPVSLSDAFDDVDVDSDGNVSPTEYAAAKTNLMKSVDFSSLDRDGDGVISPSEAKKMPPLAETFERMDSDADKLISKKEFRIAQR